MTKLAMIRVVFDILVLAAPGKLAPWQGVEFLREEATRGRSGDLASFLAVVPDVEPDECDRLP